eukprot:4408-Eustigmatos_ZCMA.PRE.1
MRRPRIVLMTLHDFDNGDGVQKQENDGQEERRKYHTYLQNGRGRHWSHLARLTVKHVLYVSQTAIVHVQKTRT